MTDLRVDLAVLDILQLLSNRLERIETKLDHALQRMDLDDQDPEPYDDLLPFK